MNTFFVADTHFGHPNIIRHCSRPFSCVEEMDETLIDNWNAVVHPNDIVYHLGDFAWKNISDYLKKLNGKFILIIGNHDEKQLKQFPKSIEKVHYKFIKLNKKKIVLSHYPFESWNTKRYGTIHLHGHCHGTLGTFQKNRLDVGVDVHNYFPISFDQVITELNKHE